MEYIQSTTGSFNNTIQNQAAKLLGPTGPWIYVLPNPYRKDAYDGWSRCFGAGVLAQRFSDREVALQQKSQAELMFLAGIAMSVVGGLVGSRVGSQSSGLGRQLDAKRYDDDMTTDALTTNDTFFWWTSLTTNDANGSDDMTI